MRLLIEPDPPRAGASSGAGRGKRAPAGLQAADGKHLTIGLINNMPDGAVEWTERQFLDLLDAAAGPTDIHVRLFSLPEIARSETVCRHMNGRYCRFDELWGSRLDALIVTGTEPRAPLLTEEPYWQTFTRLIDWAQTNTISTVWSCLAAHAAVLHMDGIARRQLADKRSGVFECMGVSPHVLLTTVSPRIRVAHSRWNELSEQSLTACNYTILTRSAQAGVDAFVKQTNSLFVFFQGHPEYDRHALLREYRRDIGRFLRRERETYPVVPDGYFKPAAVDALQKFRHRATTTRQEHLIESFPTAFLETGLVPVSTSWATRMYGNWLSHLCDQKDHAKHAHAKNKHAKQLRPKQAQVAEEIS